MTNGHRLRYARQSRRRRVVLESLECRRLLAAFSNAELSAAQQVHVDTLQAACTTQNQELVFYADFEQGLDGFTADNSGGTLPGLWHHSLGRRADGQPNHSPISSFYYGLFETAQGQGRYDTLPFDHQGRLFSPAIALPSGTNTLQFNYFLATRPPIDVDFVDVSIVDVNAPGSAPVTLLSRENGTLQQTGTTWQNVCAELPAEFANTTVQIVFRFDTGDVVNIDPEGWYVDDVLITNLATADLSIRKSADDDTPNEGQLVTYTITASNSNLAQVTATGVTVTDLLPSGVTFVDASESEGSYDVATGLWTGLQLAPGETQTLTIQATVNSGTAGTTLTNIASIAGDQTDSDPTNDMVTQVSTVNSVDLAIEKTADDPTPNEGQTLTYTLIATSGASSNAAATNVTVQESLPSGTTFVSASSPNFDATTQIWSVGDLAIGAVARLDIVVTVNNGTSGDTLDNVVTINGDETDPNLGDNTFTQTSTVNRVDLLVEKTVDDDTSNEGQSLGFTINVTNLATSNAIATSVVLVDMLPPGVTFVDATPAATFDPATRTVTWNASAIGIGEVAAFLLTATVDAGTSGQTLENVASANGDETDPDPNNNISRETLTVNSVDLQVTKSADNISPMVGDVVTFTVTVTNDAGSNAAATGVVIRDELPDGLRVISISSPGIFDSTTREITWSNVDIAIGQSLDFTVQTLVEASASGKLLKNVAVAAGDQTDPLPPSNGDDVSIAVGSTIQFIAPLSVYRLQGSFPPPDGTTDLTPSAGQATIAGHKWHDVDQDGVWDADEPGRSGWRFFLDLNNDGRFDTQVEPSAVTDINGRYVFSDLAPGTYTIREVPTQTSDGVFEIRSSDQFQVTVSADEIFAGQFGVAESPNFGVFDFSPFIRPADDFADRISDPVLVRGLTPWQVFTISNTSDDVLNVLSLDTSQISGRGSEFIRLRQLSGGTVTEINLPVAIPVGEAASFLLTYDPAIRNGDTVTEQFPDWLGDKRLTNPAHRFATDDQIVVVTDQNAMFRVGLLGGSTYDSDIDFDGLVGNLDVIRFGDVLNANLFDPTSDINVRCPNGAEQVVASCSWPINGPPQREIGLGDFGTLNREIATLSARSPFLDLDPTDRSGIAGSGFLTESVDGVAPIVAFDASFANDRSRVLQSLTVIITNATAGDTLRVDSSLLPGAAFTFNGGSIGDLGDTTSLTISGDAISLQDYELALQAITFQSAAGSTGRVATISIQAVGSQSLDGPFTRLLDDAELLSNLAIARIVVPNTAQPALASRQPASGEFIGPRMEPAVEAESDLDFPETCLPTTLPKTVTPTWQSEDEHAAAFAQWMTFPDSASIGPVHSFGPVHSSSATNDMPSKTAVDSIGSSNPSEQSSSFTVELIATETVRDSAEVVDQAFCELESSQVSLLV